MERLAPIYVADLFAPLHRELIALLGKLEPADWDRSTVAGDWKVRDIAAHLLDGILRKLSAHRDGHLPAPDRPLHSYADVLALINGLNAGGVAYMRRLSPRLLTDLLDVAGRWMADFTLELDPHAQALFSVAWAGESTSENWMDTGREYTEWWHHQMQIRDAVGAPGLLEARWLLPLLDLSVRALPHAYASTVAPEGTAITLAVPGEEPWAWTLVREVGTWQIYRGETEPPAAPAVRVTAAPDRAWRLFYNALPPEQALRDLTIEGDEALAEPLLRTRSVMV